MRLQAEKRAKASVPTIDELRIALAEDIETLEIDVFSPRLRHFFGVELRDVLTTAWRNLDYHVGTACSGCEYLGYSWNSSVTPDADHCMPRAAADGHLSSIAFLPKGARRALGDISLTSTQSLAPLTTDNAAFDCHPKLRATRTVVAGRAQSLGSGASSIPKEIGPPPVAV